MGAWVRQGNTFVETQGRLQHRRAAPQPHPRPSVFASLAPNTQDTRLAPVAYGPGGALRAPGPGHKLFRRRRRREVGPALCATRRSALCAPLERAVCRRAVSCRAIPTGTARWQCQCSAVSVMSVISTVVSRSQQTAATVPGGAQSGTHRVAAPCRSRYGLRVRFRYVFL